MIYSQEHDFLFIKNYKVGGTSIEVELSRILPDSAVVTNIYPPNQNHLPRNNDGFYNHMSYLEIKKIIPSSEKAKKYIIVRNPYDMLASNYFYYLLDKIDIKEWFNLSNKEKQVITNKYFEEDPFKSSKNLYVDENNNSVIDYYLKYENGLEQELNKVLSWHNLPSIQITTFEKQYRPKKITYLDIFNNEQLDWIYNNWEWEFNTFGYQRNGN